MGSEMCIRDRLGRWQPWHDGHQALFNRCVAKTGQVIIQVRDVEGSSGGDGQDDNPFNWDDVCKNIEEGLSKDGYRRGLEYEIMLVPNVVNITYGRGVGYAFDEEVFGAPTFTVNNKIFWGQDRLELSLIHI